MKAINIVYLGVGIIGGIILAIVAVLSYLDEKPRIKGTAEYSSWNTPSNVSFNGFRSYAKMDIRNAGNAEAKDLKLHTPFRGSYLIDNKGEPQEFENDISLADLNPSEGYIVEVWSQTSQSRSYLGNVYVTHTRGTSDVDFGYMAFGMSGKFFWFLDQIWVIVFFLLFYAVVGVCYLIYKKVNAYRLAQK